jgi:hypothetical protein
MKAEHRKELETNTLAEGMGHLVQRMKDRPRRSTVGYVVAGAVFLVVLLFVLRWYHLSSQESAQRWFELEDGRKQVLDSLIKSAGDSNAGKAALLEKSWITFWEEGMKGLGHSPNVAMKQLDAAFTEYSNAAKLCEGDPTFEPEALYAMAVIEETKALMDRKRLDSARDMYEKLALKYDSAAFGKLAGQRVALLKDDQRRKELVQFYQNLSAQLGLDRPEPKTKAPELRELEKKLKLPIVPE